MKETNQIRNQPKVGFLSDYESQPKRLREWKKLPTHTLTPMIFKFNFFRPKRLNRNQSNARGILRLQNNLQRMIMKFNII